MVAFKAPPCKQGFFSFLRSFVVKKNILTRLSVKMPTKLIKTPFISLSGHYFLTSNDFAGVLDPSFVYFDHYSMKRRNCNTNICSILCRKFHRALHLVFSSFIKKKSRIQAIIECLFETKSCNFRFLC